MNERNRWLQPLVKATLFLAVALLPSAHALAGPGYPQPTGRTHSWDASVPEPSARWAKITGGAGLKTASFVVETPDGGWIYDGATNAYGAVERDYWQFKVDGSGTPVWASLYGTSLDDVGAAQATPDGGTIVAGSTTGGTGTFTTWIMKLDGAGSIQWQKSYALGVPIGQNVLGVSKILPDGYLLSGLGFDMTLASLATLLVKIDLTGNIVWQKSYAVEGVGLQTPSVVRLSDGSLMLGGILMHTDSNQDIDLCVIKLTSAGDVVWAKTYGGPQQEIGGTGLIVIPDGGFLLQGQTKSWGPGGPPDGMGDIWEVKLDSAGNIQWQFAYGGPGEDTGIATPDNSGGYFIGATTTSFGAGKEDLWAVKLDNSGQIVWQKTYGGAEDDYGAILFDPAGSGYLLSATTLSFGAGGRDEWLAKLDASGNIVWQRTYGTTLEEEGAAYRQPSGEIFLQGHSKLPSPPTPTVSDAWFIRASDVGDLGAPCPFIREAMGVVGVATGVAVPTTATPQPLTVTASPGTFVASAGAIVAKPIALPLTDLCSGTPPSLTASASATPSSGPAPLTVNFTGTASGGTGPYTYSWDFGDGSAASSAQNPSHTYAATGDFTVTLTVHDSASATATDAHLVIHATAAGRSVTVTWSAPAPGGMNPPQNVQASATALAFLPEAGLNEIEPNGCPAVVGGTDTLQSLVPGDTVSGAVQDTDTESCVYENGDYFEDLFGLTIAQTGTYTLTLNYSGSADLDLYLMDLPGLNDLNPPCGQDRCGITCSNPETFQATLAPGNYLLGVNLASVNACVQGASATYTLTVSESGGGGPVLQGYDIYRATADSDPSYVKLNGNLLPFDPTRYVDAGAPAGPLFYRVKAIYDQGASGWSNTAMAGGSTCSLSCTATGPATATAGQAVGFTSTATPSGCSGTPAFAWSFGDGGTSSIQNPSHTYGAAGTYAWSLTTTVDGQTCSKGGSIAVTASPSCTLSCSATAPTSGAVGSGLSFSATASPSNCSGAVTYAWSFGDGGTSTLQNPSHTYSAAGTYTWSLTATVDGQTCSKSGSLTVTGGPDPHAPVPWAWGYNSAGQLGDGTRTSSSIPVQVAIPAGIIAMEGGRQHTLALRDDGTVWSWGYNFDGELGNGTEVDSIVPVQTVGLTGATGVAAGSNHSLAVKEDGTVWAWGNNHFGQLGDGTGLDYMAPHLVPGFSGAVAVAAGESHSYALKSDGTVWAWGYNAYGQLGNGTSGTGTNSGVPMQVIGLSSVTAIAAGHNHGLALRSDGTVWAWGYNYNGQLGDGTTTLRPVAAPVVGLTGVTKIAAGYAGSLAIRTDGTLWAWGWNGASNETHLPEQVQGLADVKGIAGGYLFALAFRGDGTLWAWGRNNYGRLGDGTTDWRDNPVQVVNIGNVRFAAAGDDHSLAVTALPDMPGDCDGNGSVSIGEVQKAINMFLGIQAVGCGADCSGDGTVSIGEVQKVINAFLGLTISC